MPQPDHPWTRTTNFGAEPTSLIVSHRRKIRRSAVRSTTTIAAFSIPEFDILNGIQARAICAAALA
jgi:hypothetical protein